MSTTEMVIDLIKQFRQLKGPSLEEHIAETQAHINEFIAFLNSSHHSEKWVKSKLANYGTWGIMEIAKEADEKGLTFEEAESIKGEVIVLRLNKPVENLIDWGSLKIYEQD